MKLFRLEAERAFPSVAGYSIVQLCAGVINIWSVFQLPVTNTFGWEYGSVVLVSSIFMFAFVTGGFLNGLLASRYHPRYICYLGTILYSGGFFLSSLLRGGSVWSMYFTYSILVGIGSGIINNTALFGVMTWLPRKKGVATGLGTSWFNLSAIVLSALILKLLGIMALTDVFKVLSIGSLVLMLIGSTMVCVPSSKKIASMNAPESAWTGKTLSQALRDARFWLIALLIFLFCGSWSVIIPIVKPLGMLRGLSEPLAGATVSLCGLMMILGKLVLGPLSDMIGRRNALFISCMASGCGAVMLIFGTGWVYMIGVWLPAFSYASGGSIVPTMVSDRFGHLHSGAIYGATFYGAAISSLIINKLSTVINASGATTGNYTFTFILCIAISAAAAITVYVIDRL